jgi:hypothetical protein
MDNQSISPVLLSMFGTVNGSVNPYADDQRITAKASGQVKKTAKRGAIMKPISPLEWYRILRAHHQWTVFQAIRYALWLAR